VPTRVTKFVEMSSAFISRVKQPKKRVFMHCLILKMEALHSKAAVTFQKI